jgi:hypothetical protein
MIRNQKCINYHRVQYLDTQVCLVFHPCPFLQGVQLILVDQQSLVENLQEFLEVQGILFLLSDLSHRLDQEHHPNLLVP